MLRDNTGKPCYITGFAKTKINQGKGFLGGYWGRGKCTGIHDNLYCTATYIYETKVPGAVEKITKENLPPSYNDMPIILISLDLIGTSAEFAKKCQKEIAIALNWPSSFAYEDRIVVSCTHTHTGPQTNQYFIGMGHATDKYMLELIWAGYFIGGLYYLNIIRKRSPTRPNNYSLMIVHALIALLVGWFVI